MGKSPAKASVRKALAEGTESQKFNPAERVGFRDLVALFNVSTRTVQITIDGGYLVKDKDGFYKLCDAVQGYARYKSDHGTRKSGTTKEASQQRVNDARARAIEQQTALAAKDLISFGEHRAIVDLIVGCIGAEMDGLPAQLTRDRAQRTEFEKKIQDMKRRMMERWEKMAQGVEESADDGDDAQPPAQDEEDA